MFSTTYSHDSLTQFKTCLWKQNLVYWRSPAYNAVRIFFTTFCALILGSVFINSGSRRSTTRDLTVVLGALYSACLFLGVDNSSSVHPVVSIERTVFYRERAAGTYSSFPYAAAQGLIELPYISVQTLVYGFITFFMINFERTLAEFLYYCLFMYLTFTYFTFYGMMASIPGWWIWFYYICPVAWTLWLCGIITSQLGDIDEHIIGPGFEGTVKEFINKSFGYGPGMIGVSAAVLIGFALLFFSVYATSIKVLNFQRR